MLTRQLQRFIRYESLGGLLLFIALFIALGLANSSLNGWYQAFIDTPIHIKLGFVGLEKPAVLWVNEGLMAIFFLLLSLEIKRERAEGDLKDISQLTLPIIGACGGILFPIAIFFYFNHGHSLARLGWPIPTTTDVAFMLAIVTLLGPRVSASLKVMLVALSIVDDIVAIVVIAFTYSKSLSLFSCAIFSLCVITMLWLNKRQVHRLLPYVLLGLVMWVAMLNTGIHATLVGVVVGLLIPLEGVEESSDALLRRLERGLHPWVAFFILPIFVLFNGGIPFLGMHWSQLIAPLPLGIALGLAVGKTLGVFVSCVLAIKCGLARMPALSTYRQLLGVSALTGIGFTMSLFLSTLAFANTIYEDASRQGVLLGSLIAMILGVMILWPKRPVPSM